MKQNVKKLLSRIAELLSRLLQWMYAWAENLDDKLCAWMAHHPKVGAWLPVSTAQVTRKSKIWVCVLLGLLLFFPIRTELPDGGSVEYRSLTYSLVRWEFFTEEIPDPRDADKVTVVRFYDPLTCRVRSIWERQSDQAAVLGCNAYYVTQRKSKNRIDKYGQTVYDVWTVYYVYVNGYRTHDHRIFIYDESGFNSDKTFRAENPVSQDEVQRMRSMLDLRLIRPDRMTPPLKTLITDWAAEHLTGKTSTNVVFWRINAPESKYHGQMVPIKTISYYTKSEDGHEHPNSVMINLLDNSTVDVQQLQ